MNFRTIREEELEKGLALARSEGWSCTHWVWKAIYDLDPRLCLAAVTDDRLVATTFGSLFESPRGAWVSLVLVEKEFRRKGIATRLVSDVVAQLRSSGASFIGLDASDEGAPVYRRIGFRDATRVLAFSLEDPKSSAASLPHPVRPSSVVPMTPELLRKAIDLDMHEFGFRREAIFKKLPLENGWAFVEDGKLKGFALSRERAGGGTIIGPLIASSKEIAATLLAAAVRGVIPGCDKFARLWTLIDNVDAMRVATSCGFKHVRPDMMTRMWLTSDPATPIPQLETGNYFGILAPEFG